MRVGALQYETVWEDPTANFDRLVRWVDAASEAECDLLVLPEMFACGFSMNVDRVAEPVDGPSTRFLREQARRARLWIGGSIPEVSPGQDRPCNTFLVAGPEGELVRYQKIHPFAFAGEDRYYAAGNRFTTVEIAGVRTTLFVCYDLRFANVFWHTADRTDCYVVVANWPESRRQHWRTLLRARAIENQAYVVGVNRVGEASGLTYVGDSAILGPGGEVLAEAEGDEGLLVASVEAEQVRETRASLPFLADRRSIADLVGPTGSMGAGAGTQRK